MKTGILLILLSFSGQTHQAPLFDTQILPVLTKSGCNSGACHGAAAGRGNFSLSLWGTDPSKDFQAIVHSFQGRRVNLVQPSDSLILLKPSGKLDHGGDIALPEDSPGARLIHAWIQSGASRGKSQLLTHFSVSATPSLSGQNNQPIRLKATAQFDNGPDIDVTTWTVFTSIDPASITLVNEEPSAQALVKRPGQHTLMARYLDRVQPVTISRPFATEIADLSGEVTDNFIDQEIVKTLSLLSIPVSGQADDGVFIRRIRLDLTGRLPTPKETSSFIGDPSKQKKAILVDRLLASQEFADYWTLRWSRLLRLHSLPNEKEGMDACTTWLKQVLHQEKPLDHWARELILANGDSHFVGPAYFARMANDARSHAEMFSRVFLGTRLQCANCHNHPMDRWTQDDYHGLAAIFSRIDRSRIVKITDRGGVTNPRTGEPAIPRLPGERNLSPGAESGPALAEWLISRSNPHFARAQVNWLWRSMFGRGLIEPVDDLRDTNPATHPVLLDRLAADFANNNYHLKRIIRLIAMSRTYARSSHSVPGNATDNRYYGHFINKELEAEVLADAIVDVTGVGQLYPGKPVGTRAISLYDPLIPSPSLDILGRCSRNTGCDNPATETGLPAKLHLLNGEFLNGKITDPKGRLGQLLSLGKSDPEIIETFYLLALARRPTTKELSQWISRFKVEGASKTDAPLERKIRLEDFLWALLNSREFTTNH